MAKKKSSDKSKDRVRTSGEGAWYEFDLGVDVLDHTEPIKPRRKPKPPRRRKPNK